MYIEYGVDDDPWTPAPAPAEADGEGNWSWTTPELTPFGIWEFRAKAVDKWGNSSPWSERFKLNIHPGVINAGAEGFESESQGPINLNNGYTFSSGLKIQGTYTHDARIVNWSDYGGSGNVLNLNNNFEDGTGFVLTFTLPSLAKK